MRINKIIFLLTLPFLIELLVACCYCPDTVYYSYTNCSMTISVLNNSGPRPVVTQLNTIPKEAFGIRVEIHRNEYVCEAKPVNSYVFQSAYAMSCDCPPEFQFLPLDEITNLKITTVNDFDSEHPANADVTEYFYVSSGYEFTEIPDYVHNIQSELNGFVTPTLEFDLLLMYPPTLGSHHQFSIEVELSDGRFFNVETKVLELN